MEIVKIGDNDFKMQSSAYTQFAYKNKTGRSMLQDLQQLIKFSDELQNREAALNDLDPISELILNIAYVMIEEADKTQVTDFESFLKSIPSLYDDMEWIYKVIRLGCSPISRQLQNNQN